MRFPKRVVGVGVAVALLAGLGAAPAGASALRLADGYSCTVTNTTYTWSTGFTANLQITNDGTRPFKPWIIQLVYPGEVSLYTSWYATWTQTPPSIQGTNPTWDPAIDPGETVTSIGFVATFTDTYQPPTTVTVNGVPCTIE